MDDAPRLAPTRASTPAAYFELTKPGITAYVMITTGVSAFVASRGGLGLVPALHLLGGTGLSTAGALALNQYLERDTDARMTRTRDRPLPSGRLTPRQGLVFGALLLVAGLGHLAYRVGPWPAGLAAASALAYLGVYTPLKRHSYAATLAGGFPGAFPALIGWTGATGRFDWAGLSLFAIAYLWQLPHVLGLAWMLKDDYARVGFRLVPAGGARVIGAHMVAATAALIPASVVPTLLGYTGTLYLGAALVASSAFLGVAIGSARELTEATAKRLFLSSLLYHPVLLGLMLLDTVRL